MAVPVPLIDLTNETEREDKPSPALLPKRVPRPPIVWTKGTSQAQGVLPIRATAIDLKRNGRALGVATVAYMGRHWVVFWHRELDGDVDSTSDGEGPFRVLRFESLRTLEGSGDKFFQALVEAFVVTNERAGSDTELALFYLVNCNFRLPTDLINAHIASMDIGPVEDWLYARNRRESV